MTTRRRFLQTAGVGLFTPWVLASATSTAAVSRNNAAAVFSLSVASGDPSPTGVILWTRIDPAAFDPPLALRFEVASDDRFRKIVLRGEIPAGSFGPEGDYTARIDLDGHLSPGRRYAYRFLYGNVASRTGFCRTLPGSNAFVWNLRLGVVTFQDYTNGYYGAFARLAETHLDFVLHLGDFIYETTGDPRFQSLPYPDRAFMLPSGERAATGLNDFRFLYRKYRSDPLLQKFLEQHTLITLWDDHETANDCYWDYDRDTLGAPDHPFVTDQPNGGDPVQLRGLKLAAQQAWSEYVPARVTFDSHAAHPFQALQIYRRFRFGRLIELFATDERTYRDAPPCGDDRVLTFGCGEQAAPQRSMLGTTQRDWFLSGVTQSTATWKVWANEVFLGQLKVGREDGQRLYATLDAWDGFEAERRSLLTQMRDAGVTNFVALTGDLHSYIAAYLKVDYLNRANTPGSNLVGVEFMTPSITSSTLIQGLINQLTPDDRQQLGLAADNTRHFNALETIIRLANPHIHFFNSQEWGYSIVEFTPWDCTYSAYSVPTSINSPFAPQKLIRKIRVPVNQTRFVDVV
jgi:alkaline phosphatase D